MNLAFSAAKTPKLYISVPPNTALWFYENDLEQNSIGKSGALTGFRELSSSTFKNKVLKWWYNLVITDASSWRFFFYS